MIPHNLLSNAVKYNRDGGRVDVTVARGDRATLEVATPARGSRERRAGRLFREFVRIRTRRTRT